MLSFNFSVLNVLVSKQKKIRQQGILDSIVWNDKRNMLFTFPVLQCLSVKRQRGVAYRMACGSRGKSEGWYLGADGL